MRFDKLRKQLELLVLLSDGRNYTVEELCERMELSRRNFYYLLDFIRHAGFIVFKHEGCYHIDRRSPFFTRLLQAVQFTDNDIRTIYSLLTMADNGSSVAVNQLRRKIENAYALSVSAPSSVRLLPHTNKTFKISRMKDVEELDTPWLHEDRHRQVFTDIFMFSGEERHRVKLRLGQLSHNLFVEEYPQGVRYVARQEDSSWLLDIEVCDYRGLGRFVLGLYKDIDIVEGEGFMAYMQEEIESLTRKASPRKASPPAPLRVERGVNSGLPL